VPDNFFARLCDLAESLTGDVVFAMSRGSKELFHSDTLAWYVEHLPCWARPCWTLGAYPGAATDVVVCGCDGSGGTLISSWSAPDEARW